MMTLLTRDNLTLAYEEWGDIEAPPVVLIHSLTADMRMWLPLAGELARGYRVIAPDLRGHGLSEAPDDLEYYTMDAYCGDLGALLDSLAIDVCALAGAGFGGMVALQFAIDHPERVAGLVLSDTTAGYQASAGDAACSEHEALIDSAVAAASRFGMAELAKRAALRVRDPFLAEGVRKHYGRLSRAGFLGGVQVRRSRPNLLPVLRDRLAVPVLVCTGANDPIRSESLAMADAITGARVVTFRDAGHGVPNERGEAFADVVLAFFSDVEEGRPIAGRRTV